jgi:two-component system, response regulator RegA
VTPTQTQTNVLVVDDDAVFRERLGRAFRDRGYRVKTAANHDEAMQRSSELEPMIAIVDLRLPGPSGLQIVADLRAHFARLQILVLTGYGSIANALEAVRLGADNYLSKPADVEDIEAALSRATNATTSGEEQTTVATPSLARVEWEHIQRVLADCGGNLSEASRRLGVHRRSLQRKVQKYPPAI